MTMTFHGLESFPMFVDCNKPVTPNPFSSNMAMISYFDPKKQPRSSVRPIPTPQIVTKVNNYLALKYYQYEVTFGLYMMTPNEKIVLNSIVLILLGLLFYGFVFGIQPVITKLLCRSIYYLTGTFNGVEELCS